MTHERKDTQTIIRRSGIGEASLAVMMAGVLVGLIALNTGHAAIILQSKLIAGLALLYIVTAVGVLTRQRFGLYLVVGLVGIDACIGLVHATLMPEAVKASAVLWLIVKIMSLFAVADNHRDFAGSEPDWSTQN